MRLCRSVNHRLLFHQRPDTIPVGAGGCGAKLRDAAEEYLARYITGLNGETALETGTRSFPILAAIVGERFVKGIAQCQSLARDLALATEQFEDALWLGLADDQYLVDLAGLHDIGSETAGFFADQYARAIGLIGPFEARGQIHRVADDCVVARLLRADIADHDITGGDADADIDLRKACLRPVSSGSSARNPTTPAS